MSKLVCLGKIVAAHGIRGEVKVKSFTENPKDVLSYGNLSNKDGTRIFETRFVGFSKELLRVKIKGVDTRNDAENLKGTELYIERSKLPNVSEDTFYQADLVGLKAVRQKTSEQIGEVVGIYNFGAGDILEVKFDGLKRTEMLPFNNTYVPDVDLKKGVVLLSEDTMAYLEDEGKDEG